LAIGHASEEMVKTMKRVKRKWGGELYQGGN